MTHWTTYCGRKRGESAGGNEREEGEGTHIAVLILNKVLRVAVELVEKSPSLRRRAVLEDALENTASVRVSSETMNLTDAGVGDEVEVLGRDTLKSALREREGKEGSASEAERQRRRKRRTNLDDVVALSIASAF
jgi:hypothetical protein